jgi:hypothetical protein
MDKKEAAKILKAYLLQHRISAWNNAQQAYIEMNACNTGTCGNIDDMKEEDKKKELERRRNEYLKKIRAVDHDTIAIFVMQSIIEE